MASAIGILGYSQTSLYTTPDGIVFPFSFCVSLSWTGLHSWQVTDPIVASGVSLSDGTQLSKQERKKFVLDRQSHVISVL